MPDAVVSMEYLSDLDLYKVEKPYIVMMSAANRDDSIPTHNLEFETHNDIVVHDIRGREEEFTLEGAGFTVLHYESKLPKYETTDDFRCYQEETVDLLTDWFNAELVVTWDVRRRLHAEPSTQVRDLRDWTVPERVARGAHNDVSLNSGRMIIEDHLPQEAKAAYLKPGYRFRIVNTWRPAVPVLEDSPLSLCDFRSIDKEDLIECDRVIPTKVGEIYYLRHNAQQKWHWLEKMTPHEMFLFIMYDTAEGNQARYCPHVPFENPRAPPNAPPRQSLETRSIIITRT